MKTIIKNDFEAIKDYLNDLSSSELVSIHNEYCNNNNMDDTIYSNDEEFFSTFFDNDVIKAVRAASYGEYKFSDEWVMFNGYANLESFDYPNDRIDITELANNIQDNPNNYDIELEEEEEEED